MSEHIYREAELTAAQLGIQRQGLPAMLFLKAVCETLRVTFSGLGVLLDNTAMIEIVCTGRNLTIRHISKTHGVAVSWLHEIFSDPEVRMRYITTSLMAADLYTRFHEQSFVGCIVFSEQFVSNRTHG